MGGNLIDDGFLDQRRSRPGGQPRLHPMSSLPFIDNEEVCAP